MNFLKQTLLLIGCCLPLLCCAQQERPENANCMNQQFDKKVDQLISYTVPVMDVNQLKQSQKDVIILDAREKEEYDISHIKGAQYIGYNKLEKATLKKIDKDATIVVYCSVGYRSEKIGEKLQKMGYTDVHNLYGSIFEWINRGNEVVDKNGQVTNKIHTYNKKWSQWVEEGKADKVW